MVVLSMQIFPVSNRHWQPCYFIIAEQCCWNNVVETMLNNIVGPTMVLMARMIKLLWDLYVCSFCFSREKNNYYAKDFGTDWNFSITNRTFEGLRFLVIYTLNGIKSSDRVYCSNWAVSLIWKLGLDLVSIVGYRSQRRPYWSDHLRSTVASQRKMRTLTFYT